MRTCAVRRADRPDPGEGASPTGSSSDLAFAAGLPGGLQLPGSREVDYNSQKAAPHVGSRPLSRGYALERNTAAGAAEISRYLGLREPPQARVRTLGA